MVAATEIQEVRVEAYRGPLDLLLYLIKEEEVDIYDIPIARVLGRYLEELARIETLDINAAGDFLVMAATLMEIKSRQMLPPEEREALDLEEEDPRSDLIRQLLEYRRFRQAADELGGLAERRKLLFGRAGFAQGLALDDGRASDPGEELRDVETFDLLHAFEDLMRSILADVPRTIVYDDVSVEERVEEIILSLREGAGAEMRFSDFARRATDRADAAGILQAMLEATRRKLITIYQPEPLGEMYVTLRGERPDSEFAPSPEEQPRDLTEKEMVVRRGSFQGFVETEEETEEDLDFAFDSEGHKAITRLEDAVRRAGEAVRRFAKPKPKPPEDAPQGPLVRQWTDDGSEGQVAPAPEAEAGAEGQPGTESEKPRRPTVRQWNDPDAPPPEAEAPAPTTPTTPTAEEPAAPPEPPAPADNVNEEIAPLEAGAPDAPDAPDAEV